MPNYKNGKIYMIYPCVKNADKGDIYIGSTIQSLAERMRGHRHDYNHKCSNITSMILFEKYGLENCKIELIHNYPCDTKQELLREEGKIMRERDCVNKVLAGRTAIEYCKYWREKNADYDKERQLEWRQNNKEYVKEKAKVFYKENKEEIKEKNYKWIQENKEKRQKYLAEWREINKERLNKYQRKRYNDKKDRA